MAQHVKPPSGQVQAAQLLIQCQANLSRKAVRGGSSCWASASDVVDSDEALGSLMWLFGE